MNSHRISIYFLGNKYSETFRPNLREYMCRTRAIGSSHVQLLFHHESDTYELLCKIIHPPSPSPVFLLTILCRTPRRERVERVCETLMRSINASAKRDGSIGPKIHPLADAYRGGMMLPHGGNPGDRISSALPRLCLDNQWTRL